MIYIRDFIPYLTLKMNESKTDFRKAALTLIAIVSLVGIVGYYSDPTSTYTKTNVFTYDLVVHNLGFPAFDKKSCIHVFDEVSRPECPKYMLPIMVVPGQPVPTHCKHESMVCNIRLDHTHYFSSFKVGYNATDVLGYNHTIVIKDMKNAEYTYPGWPYVPQTIIYEKLNVFNHIDSFFQCKGIFGSISDCKRMFE